MYYNLDASANFLRLKDGGVHMVELAQMYEDVQEIATLYTTYIALNGVNIIMCLLRILKLMDFQPRLGVITHTMFLAASDLGHFFFIFSVIFFAFGAPPPLPLALRHPRLLASLLSPRRDPHHPQTPRPL